MMMIMIILDHVLDQYNISRNHFSHGGPVSNLMITTFFSTPSAQQFHVYFHRDR